MACVFIIGAEGRRKGAESGVFTLDGLNGHGALQTLLFQLAFHFVGLGDVAVEGMGVGLAAAAAIEARPALGAFFLGEHGILLEARLHGGIKGAVQHRAHAHPLAAHELVAGVDVAVRSYGHVLVARAAAGETLAQTGAAGQIHHKVEETEPCVRIAAADHVLATQTLVFLEYAGQVTFADGVVVALVGDDRLDGELLKALVRQVKHVVCKVRVKVPRR